MDNASAFDMNSSLMSTWLQMRVHETEACITRVHTAFQQILDGIVSRPLDTASQLLSNPASNVEEKASAADQLLQCNYKILSMTMVLNSMFTNPDNLRALCNQFPNLPEPFRPHNNQSQLPLGVNYIQLETYSPDNAVAHVENPQIDNESQPNLGTSKSCPSQFDDDDRTTTGDLNSEDNGTKQHQRNINIEALMEYESSASESMSATSPSRDHVDEVSGTNITVVESSASEPSVSATNVDHVQKSIAVNECNSGYASDKSLCLGERVKSVADTDSSSVYVGTPSSCDDLREFIGIVSEVETPSKFYVQRTSDLETLEVVQFDLNASFRCTKQVGDKLRFQNAPKPGDLCVAQYTDNNWYRCKVLQLVTPDSAIVEYIDYGNADDILWSKAFKMPESFAGIPALSIRCTLGGVRPVGGRKQWDADSAKWFDEMMFGSNVTVVPIFKKSEAISVQLFMGSAEAKKASICVSDFMVEAGFAEYDVHEECLGTGISQSVRNTVCKSQGKSATTTVKDQRKPVAVPLEVEADADNRADTSQKAVLDNPKSVRSQSNEDVLQQSNVETVKLNLDDLSKWNPLAEDFQSASNNYGVNNENVCTMIEGYDPEKVNVCRYHRIGHCWRGDQCPYVHLDKTDNGEFKTQVQTFSGSSIAKLSFSAGNVYVVRVTKIDEARNFQVHVIKMIESGTKITSQRDLLEQRLSQGMRELSDDMDRYCKSGSRRMDNLLQCAVGELFIVYAAKFKCYCRGMIVSAENFNTLRVHLIDLGVDIEVSKTNLNRMCPAFMHLPKQSVQCTLSQGCSELYKSIEDMVKKPESPNLMMKVLDTCEVTDGPLQVMLYCM